ncbi:extracellular solute-binding protein [Streptomyces sp. NPDC088923]|uniref:extracellular solute-binding protein n=1 Tax=Streptomyces sp. NPDC088923 TaxID=3365913 RepID=UPI0037F72924
MTVTTTRRGLLRGTLAGLSAAALAPALSACGSVAGSVSSSAGKVRFWHLFQGGDGALMRQMLAKVREDVPGLDPEDTVLDWGAAYYTKLAMASAGGRAPDLAIMHLSRLAGYAPGGLLDPWDTALLEEFGVPQERINPRVRALGRYEKEPYAIPLDTHPFVVFYDRAVMDKAGLLDSDGRLLPPESPAHFLEMAEQLRKRKGKLGPIMGLFNDTAQAWRMFWGLYSQTGGAFDLSGGKPGVDRDKMVEVVEFFKKAVVDSRTMDYPAGVAAFTTGQSPFIFSGEWELPTFQGAKFDLGASPMPTLFGSPASYADSHSFVLPHQDHADEGRRRAAHQLVAELLKGSMTWAQAGHIPAYLPVVGSKAYAKLDPQSSYAPAAEHPAIDPPAWFTGAGSDFQARMCSALQQGVRGADSAKGTVAEMLSGLDFFLSKPNPA